MTAPVLRLENVVKTFGAVRAVDGISLSIREGELLTLLGPSGCGKSTILRLIAGFTEPTSGAVYLRDRLINDLPPFERETGMVFQDYALFPHMTVEENVAFGLRMRKRPSQEIAERVERALGLVRLSGFGSRTPSQLSGGQQQRIALARALIIEPTVLLLDEPLSNLDVKLREGMRIEIIAIQKELGITTLFVTHDQSEALVMSDRVVVMNAGRIEQTGTPVQIYERPESKFVAEFIGSNNFFDGTITDEWDSRGRVLFRSKRGLRILVLPPEGIVSGQRVHISLRPEKCTLRANGEGHDVALKGRVVQLAYLGSKTDYILEFEDGDRGLVAFQHSGSDTMFRPGDEVYLCAAPEDCLVLPAEA